MKTKWLTVVWKGKLVDINAEGQMRPVKVIRKKTKKVRK